MTIRRWPPVMRMDPGFDNTVRQLQGSYPACLALSRSLGVVKLIQRHFLLYRNLYIISVMAYLLF